MGKPLLSICVPTLNRAWTIKRLLDSIVNQKWFTHEVEVVIDDGPSTDYTEELVKKYQKKYSNIRYFRNTKAIGMQPALLEAVSLSNWIYTWLFWSDDFMYCNSLEITLNLIKKHSPTLILYKGMLLDDIKKCEGINQSKQKIICSVFKWFSEFWEYISIDDQGSRYDKINYFSSICIFCFKTSYYNDMLQFTKTSICTPDELKWNYFNYILIIYSNLSIHDKICVIDSPKMVFSAFSNTGSWSPNPQIADDSKMLVNYLKKKYTLSQECIKLLNKISFGWRLSCRIIGPIRKSFPFISKLLSHPLGRKLWGKVYYMLTNLFR